MSILRVEHARPFVALSFPTAGREAIAWLDTGGGAFIVGRHLGDDLGLETIMRVIDGQEHQVVDLPLVTVGGGPLKTEDCYAVQGDRDLISDGFPAEAFVPGHVLARHGVVLDYPAGTFALDPVEEPRGERSSAQSHPRPGWPAVTVSLAGEEVNLLLDTGASCCMLSERVIERLGGSISRRVRGAVGLANMSAGAWEARVETVRLPSLRWGGVEWASVIAVSRPEGNFEGMMSSGTPIPVEGAIGGNVLRQLRLQWSAQEQAVWIEPAGLDAGDVHQVPLVLRANEGRCDVVGLVGPEASPPAINVRPGDVLAAVDGVPVNPDRFGDVVAQLSGQPGEAKELDLIRDGATLTVTTHVDDVV